MNPTPVRRDALCRRYPRNHVGVELGTLLSICLTAYAAACVLLLG